MTEKKCKICEVVKSHDLFTTTKVNGKKYLYSYCKECKSISSKKRYIEKGSSTLTQKQKERRRERRIEKIMDNKNEVKVDRKDTFIKKVNHQGGWIDEIDAYRLVDIYEDLPYRKNIDNMKVGDQLIYMWEAINNKLEVNIGERKCATCKEIKSIELFTIEKKRPDGYSSYCKECIKEYYREYKRRKKSLLKDNI